MIYAYLFGALACIILGAACGFTIGMYQRAILDRLHLLENKEPVKPAPKPAVTMGAYAPIREISNVPDTRKAGIVEAKTPELVEWETGNAIEKQVLGVK